MRRRLLTVLAVVAFLCALLFASAAGAQERTAETTVRANDAATAGVEATTSNVSAETGNGSASGKTGSQQSSKLTVSQAQTGEGTRSQAASDDLNTAQNSSSSCKNPKEVGRIDESDADGLLSFTTTGEKFRVSYDVTFNPNAPEDKKFSIVIRRNGAEVDSDETKVDTTQDFIVTEGPDTYELEATVTPQKAVTGTTFTVTVDDCLGTNGGNGGGNKNRNHDHHGKAVAQGAADNQYAEAKVIAVARGAADNQYAEAKVITKSIPNKANLTKTGGMPLSGVAFLALALVGLGISVLRFAIRRDP
jgi:hypothetical protein